MHLASLLIEADRGSEAAATKSMMARALGTPPPVVEAHEQTDEQPDFDWSQAETEVGDLVPSMFADSSDEPNEVRAYDVEQSSLTLADVGGMDEVRSCSASPTRLATQRPGTTSPFSMAVCASATRRVVSWPLSGLTPAAS
jgi:hypothetical protein